MNLKYLAALTLAASAAPLAVAGPFAYALCQTGCNMLAISCYAAAGFTFGAVAVAAAPPVIIACNACQGTCMAVCAASLFAPTP